MYTVIVSFICITKSLKLKFFSWAWWEESLPNTFNCTGRQNHTHLHCSFCVHYDTVTTHTPNHVTN